MNRTYFMNSGNQPFYVHIGRMELPYYIRGKEEVEFGGNTLAQPFLRFEQEKCFHFKQRGGLAYEVFRNRRASRD